MAPCFAALIRTAGSHWAAAPSMPITPSAKPSATHVAALIQVSASSMRFSSSRLFPVRIW